ncbi:MAG: ATP-binding protein [Christensenellales bacterium]
MRDLSLHILDIAENSLSAGSSLVTIDIKAQSDVLTIRICDNGRGMSEYMMERVKSPFVTTRKTRDIGLGIPLFALNCENSGGGLKVTSAPKEGTQILATLGLSHIDRPPLGDIAQTAAVLALTNENADFVLTASRDENKFSFDTRIIKETLGGVPISQPQVSAFIHQYLQEGLKQVFGGKEI